MMLRFIAVLCTLFSFHQCLEIVDKSYSSYLDSQFVVKGVNCEKGLCAAEDESYETIFQQNAESYTHLYLFTRETGEEYTEIIYKNLSSVTDSAFDINKNTKVIVHGWLVSAFKAFEQELKDSYLATQDVNVVLVDWSSVADQLYVTARRAVVPVGEFLAQVLDWLVQTAGVSLDKVHIVGHSLGAHIAGTVGEHLSVGNLSRITGLDPAGPGFSSSTSGRLDPTDAQFVDVIHSCGKVAGYFDPCGHADFYPNKGTAPQPGCLPPIVVCSHGRSHEYFNESISSEGFISRACDSWNHFTKGKCDDNSMAVMGEFVDTSARGRFYLHTGKTYPYALGYVSSTHYNNISKSKNLIEQFTYKALECNFNCYPNGWWKDYKKHSLTCFLEYFKRLNI